jgi:hypothetical protein
MRGGFMTNPSSGQARDPAEKLTRAQLIQRLREAEASLDAAGMGSWELFLATGAIRRS